METEKKKIYNRMNKLIIYNKFNNNNQMYNNKIKIKLLTKIKKIIIMIKKKI